MLKLTAPQKTTAELVVLAASGARGISPKARLALTERVHAEMREQLAKRGEVPR